MTGFGKGEAVGESYLLTTEIKSVNNRFKDYRFRLPSLLSSQEIILRKEVEKNFQRGSFEISLNYKLNSDESVSFDLDEKKINTFIEKIKEITKKSKVELSIRPTDFLRKEFFFDNSTDKQEELVGLVADSFQKAILDLKRSREEEGEKLIEKIQEHIEHYRIQYKSIFQYAESYEQAIKERIIKKFEEYKEIADVDNQRFLQEVIFYLEKQDIHEELNRIEIHLKKFDKLLTTDGELGRQIDFLIQELNRETNTIGSKSSHPEISNTVVQMKVHLEKIREQALNME